MLVSAPWQLEMGYPSGEVWDGGEGSGHAGRGAACSRFRLRAEMVGRIQPKLCFDRGLGFLHNLSNCCIIIIIIIIIIILY